MSHVKEGTIDNKPDLSTGSRGKLASALIVALSGLGAGLNLTAAGLAGDSLAWWIPAGNILAGLGLFLGTWVLLRRALYHALGDFPGPRRRFGRIEPLICAPALLTLLGSAGFHVPWTILLVLILVAGGAGLYAGLPPAQRRNATTSQGYLAVLFLLSGFAALIYQIVWQRTLFTIYGVNIESITIIVALFMFGLGVGSFIGGLLARKLLGRAAELFLLCQLGIGLFGLVSVPLIQQVGEATLNLSLPGVSLVIFALLALPTFLMGATLPILVSHVYRYYRNVGESVGLLYAINTVGSAIACFLTADLLFLLTGLQTSVYIAAGCNVIVGLLVWRYARSLQRRADPPAATDRPAPTDEPTELRNVASLDRKKLAGWGLLFLAGATGYISLSQEIVWMRLISYMTGGRPAVFAHVLGCFLLGVAFGALMGKRLCRDRKRSVLGLIALMLLISGGFYYLSILATAWLAQIDHGLSVRTVYLIVGGVSFLLGGIFPLICHEAAQAGKSVGLTVSRVYVANIVGSTAGPLVTGFVLMDIFSSATIILILSLAALALGALVLLLTGTGKKVGGLALAGALAALLLVLHGPAMKGLFLHIHRGPRPEAFSAQQETRSGVITVAADPKGDIVYGGGVYDGRFAIDPVVNANMIDRCYWIAALHPDPKQVLEIGLSTGSWARVLADYGPVENLTIVEINPGYLDLIRDYPDQAALLSDPKVNIAIDDGRRWLTRHPDQTFDFILQNTTFHWRSHATGLLSREYFQLAKSRLKPGGVLYLNATGSDEIAYTAANVFAHVLRFRNFVAMSDEPFDLTDTQVRENLRKFLHDGQSAFAGPQGQEVLERLAEAERTDLAPQLRKREDLRVITDDNMATEYKKGQWIHGRATWWDVFSRLGG